MLIETDFQHLKWTFEMAKLCVGPKSPQNKPITYKVFFKNITNYPRNPKLTFLYHIGNLKELKPIEIVFKLWKTFDFGPIL